MIYQGFVVYCIMKQYRLSKDQKEELFELYKTYNYSYKDLAKIFNKTVSSISCLLNREGLKGRKDNNPFRTYEINQNYFDEIDCEEKAYFLGFLCADGCNHQNNTKVTMHLKEEDKDILIKLNDLLQPQKPLSFVKGRIGTNQYGIQISNKRISERLNELGCTPRKSFTLNLPSNEQVPEHLFRHYLRGYFDGDGWLGKKDISITSSHLFCEKLSNKLFEEFDIKTRNRVKNKITELCFSRYSVVKFLDWIYKDSNIFLERKYQRYLEYHKNAI